MNVAAARLRARRRARAFPNRLQGGPRLVEGRGAKVSLTSTRHRSGRPGRAGHDTAADAGFDATNSRAMLCGPEVMMRFTARALVDLGMDPEGILVSLERQYAMWRRLGVVTANWTVPPLS